MGRFFGKRRKSSSIIGQYDSESHGTMEIQRLFRMLYGKGESNSGVRTVMVTSAVPREGKSAIAGRLALVAGHMKRQTLVIDADMRNPTQHHLFQLAHSSPGLSDYLQGEAELSQIIHNTELENLKVIPSGTRVAAPGGLLQVTVSDLKTLLTHCGMHFDVVLVDTPPVLPVTDAELIAPLVDGVALVVKAGKTYREVVERAKELLQRLDCNLLGIVLNNMHDVLPHQYESRYYRSSSRPSRSE